jgi:hypothetical protein
VALVLTFVQGACTMVRRLSHSFAVQVANETCDTALRALVRYLGNPHNAMYGRCIASRCRSGELSPLRLCGGVVLPSGSKVHARPRRSLFYYPSTAMYGRCSIYCRLGELPYQFKRVLCGAHNGRCSKRAVVRYLHNPIGWMTIAG